MSLHDGFDCAAEALKVRHRTLFLEIQRANRAWPGGVTEGFKVMGIHPTATLAALSPDEYDQAPSLLLALEYISYFKPRAVVHYIAGLADCITVPAPSTRKAFPSRKAAADDLASKIRRVLMSDLEDAAGTPSLSRAQAIQSDLLALIDAAHAMYIKLSPVSQDVRTQSPRPLNQAPGLDCPASPSSGDRRNINQASGAPMGGLHTGTEEPDIGLGY